MLSAYLFAPDVGFIVFFRVSVTLSSIKRILFTETMEKKNKSCPSLSSHPLLLNVTLFALNTELSNSASCSFHEHSPNSSSYYLGQFPQGFTPSCTLAFLTQYSFSEFPTLHSALPTPTNSTESLIWGTNQPSLDQKSLLIPILGNMVDHIHAHSKMVGSILLSIHTPSCSPLY